MAGSHVKPVRSPHTNESVEFNSLPTAKNERVLDHGKDNGHSTISTVSYHMTINLTQILSLVGKLDDSLGEQTSSKRFRVFLKENVKDIAIVRDYVEECLRNKGDQYNCALQDLINFVGEFLGFVVEYGRYRGITGELGFDGHWTSKTGFHLVIEVKTTEVYSITTSTLTGYVDGLISQRRVPNWDQAMGLYVIGRPDPEIRALSNSIVAERRTDQLRIISSDALISLAEMMNEYDVSHEDILEVLKPSGPNIDGIADLLARLAAQRETGLPEPSPPPPGDGDGPLLPESTSYWLAPVGSDEKRAAEEVIKNVVGEEHVYAFGERTPGRKVLKPGDWIAFYATGKGVVAHAKVASAPMKGEHPSIKHSDQYPYLFKLSDPVLYIDDPVIIDSSLRAKLEAFKDRDPSKGWAWLVQATRKLSDADYHLLTRKKLGQ